MVSVDDVRAELRRIVAEAPANLMREHENSANDWPSCFRTQLFVVETYLYMLERRTSPEVVAPAYDRLEVLKAVMLARHAEPDPDVKARLFEALREVVSVLG